MLFFIFSHNGCTCIQCATCSANNWVSMHKSTLWEIVNKCIRLQSTLQTRAGTLCASIKMREVLTAVRPGRADSSSAVLSARPRRGNERDACTKRDAHRRMSSADMFTRDPRQKFRRIQHPLGPCSKFVKILLDSTDFFSTGWRLALI